MIGPDDVTATYDSVFQLTDASFDPDPLDPTVNYNEIADGFLTIYSTNGLLDNYVFTVLFTYDSVGLVSPQKTSAITITFLGCTGPILKPVALTTL